MMGLALFYGDGMLTPGDLGAVSAVEGLSVESSAFEPLSCRSRWSSWSAFS